MPGSSDPRQPRSQGPPPGEARRLAAIPPRQGARLPALRDRVPPARRRQRAPGARRPAGQLPPPAVDDGPEARPAARARAQLGRARVAVVQLSRRWALADLRAPAERVCPRGRLRPCAGELVEPADRARGLHAALGRRHPGRRRRRRRAAIPVPPGRRRPPDAPFRRRPVPRPVARSDPEPGRHHQAARPEQRSAPGRLSAVALAGAFLSAGGVRAGRRRLLLRRAVVRAAPVRHGRRAPARPALERSAARRGGSDGPRDERRARGRAPGRALPDPDLRRHARRHGACPAFSARRRPFNDQR